MRMPTARFYVSIFALGATALLWLAANPQALALQNAPPARTPDQNTILPLDGTRIFRNYCASCHGVNGSGNGPVARALKTKVPLLTTLARRNHGMFPTARVRRIIAGDEDHAAHGSREMPVWGPIFHQIENDQDLGYVRLQNVTEYLISIQQK
jgi:mono/diheme cytochrome c family protein